MISATAQRLFRQGEEGTGGSRRAALSCDATRRRKKRKKETTMAVVIDGQEFYTTEEVCATLGVKPSTLDAFVSRGLLEDWRLYPRSEVDTLPAFGAHGQGHEHSENGHSGWEIPLAESWIPYTG
jgi:hypothetical protein